MYKVSKYNFGMKNENGELLLFNSFKGSLAKISKENADKAMEWFNNAPLDEEHEAFQKLVQLGFLVPEEEDEELKLSLLNVNNSNLALTILPTEQCNYRCVYCYEEFKRGKMTAETQTKLVRYVKKNIRNYPLLNISWFGGEPLVAMDVIENLSIEFMDVCKKMNRGYIASMTTNGYLLNLQTFQKLLKYNVLHYQITIDGPKEIHNKQKPLAGGGETFDVVIGNLKAIKENIKTGRFSITIRTNVTREIYDHLDEYIDFLYDNFGDDERFKFFLRPAGDWGGDSVKEVEKSLLGKDGMTAVFEKVIERNKKMKFLYRNFMYPVGSVCYAAKKNNFVIDADGNVRKCTCNLENMEKNMLGTFDDKGNMNIDFGEYAKWIGASTTENEKCKSCFYFPVCQKKSCPAIRVIHGHSEPPCPQELNNFTQILPLLDKGGEFIEVF